MSDSPPVIDRLLVHANLRGRPGDEIEPGGLVSYLPAARDDVDLDMFREMTIDVVECLGQLNHYWNGTTPTETPFQEKTCDRVACLALAEIQRQLAEHRRDVSGYERIMRMMDQAMWHINTAWCHLLHGDFDDLHESLRNDALATGIDCWI